MRNNVCMAADSPKQVESIEMCCIIPHLRLMLPGSSGTGGKGILRGSSFKANLRESCKMQWNTDFLGNYGS